VENKITLSKLKETTKFEKVSYGYYKIIRNNKKEKVKFLFMDSYDELIEFLNMLTKHSKNGYSITKNIHYDGKIFKRLFIAHVKPLVGTLEEKIFDEDFSQYIIADNSMPDIFELDLVTYMKSNVISSIMDKI